MKRNILYIAFICLTLLLLSHHTATAQELPTDSTENRDCAFHARQLIVPGTLITLGALGAINNGDNWVNRKVKDGLASESHHCGLDDYTRFLPSAAYLAMSVMPGVKAKHSLRERCAVFATSHMTMLALGYGLKGIVKETRPNGADRHSFPSGHTALAFTGAELLREEYGTWPGVAGYAVALSVGFLRMYNNEHWLNDVVMGAGIGILSARMGYWLLPVERKWLGWDKKATNFTAVPTYDPATRAWGLGLAATF